MTQSAEDDSIADILEELALDSVRLRYRSSIAIAEGFPPTWRRAALGLVVDHRLGKTLNKSTGRGVPTRYLRSVNIQDDQVVLDDLKQMLVPETELSKYNVKKGDVFVVEGGDAGRSALWMEEDPSDLAYQNALHRLRSTAAIVPEYLQLCLKDARATGQMAALATGMTIKHLSTNSLKNLVVLLPPLGEQRRIVATVSALMKSCDELQAKLEEKARIDSALRSSSLDALTSSGNSNELGLAWKRTGHFWNELLASTEGVEDLRKSILQLAVTGKMASQTGGAETAITLLQHIDLLAAANGGSKAAKCSGTRAMRTSEEGPLSLPETWQWVALEGICSHIVDCLHRTPVYSTEGYPAIRTSDIRPGKLLLDKAKKVSEDEYQRQTQRLVPQGGDVFYSREGNFGVAAVVPRDVQICLSQRMMHFRLFEGVDPRYFAWALNSPLIYQQALADSLGSTVPHVNIRSLKKFWFPLPPAAEQRRIADEVDSLMALCDSVQDAVRRRSSTGQDILRAVGV